MASVKCRRNCSGLLAWLPAAAVLLTHSPVPAPGEEPSAAQEHFLEQTEQNLREEYRACTGDTGTLRLSELLRWKQAFHDQARSAEYKPLLAQYLAETGARTPVRPCEVLAWHAQRQEELRRRDLELGRKVLGAADSVLDSLSVLRDMAANHPSAYDFGQIAFGLSQPSVKAIFGRQQQRALSYEYPYLYCRDVAIAGGHFTVAFYFDLKGRLHKYELEGPDAPATALDRTVRPQLKDLHEHFRDKLGAPVSTAAVGRHDITTGRLARTAHWGDDSTSADIGIGTYNNRLYAKAIVTRRLAPPPSPVPPAARPADTLTAPATADSAIDTSRAVQAR